MAGFQDASEDRLLRALAEQLKLPLIQIARKAELARGDVNSRARSKDVALQQIEYTADMTMRLIDSYLLSVQLQALPNLELEPVPVSVILQETAHQLRAVAEQHDCDIEIAIAGKYEPVMAHRQAFAAAYMSLGYAFIEMTPPGDKRHQVVLGVHRTSKGGLATGIYSEQSGLTADALRRGKALFGASTQPLTDASGTSAAGVFIADSLFSSMAAPLRAARYRSLTGLAVTLAPSHQLQLV